MASCPPPLISVRDYFRAPPRHKTKLAKGTRYWTCVRWGKTCGTKHRSPLSARTHTNQLNAAARRAGKADRASWEPESRTA